MVFGNRKIPIAAGEALNQTTLEMLLDARFFYFRGSEGVISAFG